MGLKEWNLNFRLEHSHRENRTSFSDVPLLPEIFRWNADPKSLVLFTFQPEFSELFVNGKQPRNWSTKNQNVCIFFQLPLISQSLRISWKPNCRGYREMRKNQPTTLFVHWLILLSLLATPTIQFRSVFLQVRYWQSHEQDSKLCLWLPWFVF